ncbi:sensor histidine kinase [Bradyrhizobium barranii]|uniref:histidine kinase n=1 Tax=Bradyrhizobium barranii subsp. apii TaxID=2819348 RepID=A0A8T5VIP3_9BRAD|nr:MULTISPECIES: sensor histidine kinase [Bradyrhizobium]UPT90078.1 sensor histidine kinase [Bradyrhizobium barranii subsp. apii]UPT99561.1 sensor histidine kinase [Bradyrhizobium barranii subsp. apii]
MSAIGLETSDHFVRSQHIASLDDQSRDWELVLRESHHRMKNTLTLLGASVRRDFSRPGTRDMSGAVDRFEQRIVAFGRLYQLLSDSDSLTAVSVEAFFENLCEALSEAVLEPAGIRCEAAIESGALPASQCHRLALMLTELVTNAAKHAFPNRNDALIRIEMANRDGAWLCTVADNGIGATGPLQGTGSRILEGLARSIDARLQGEANQGGTRVTIVMPTAA